MSDQHQPSIVEEVQVSIDHRLSQLQLHQESMDPTTAPSDAEHHQSSVTAPSPTRNTTPLKRRSPSPAFSPPLQQSDAGFRRQMLSEGYIVFPLPIADNERSFQTIAPILRRCNSLSSSTGNNNTPAGIPNSEVAAFVENLTRRSLFPSLANGSSGTAGLPPPHPLTRTISDPVLLSSLESPILPPRTSPGIPNSEVAAFVENLTQRSLLPSPANGSSGAAGLPPPHPLTRTSSAPILSPPRENNAGPRTDFAQENQSSSKRLKRVRFNRIHQQMKKLIDEMAVHHDLDEVVESTPESEVTLVDDKVLSCGGGPEEVAGQDVKKDVEEEAGDDVAEGTVSAERIGEGFALEFKCKCGSGYSVRIIGHHCYYKLI